MDRDLKKEDLMNLDKQTLITMLMMATSSNDLLQKTVEQLNQTVSNLTEEVALLRQNRFGRKSEKKLAEADGQYVFIFNETEVTIDLYKDDTGISGPETEETETVSYVRKKHSGKRKEDLSRIREREVINHELSQEELLVRFPDGRWNRLPDEVYERVELVPAKLKVYEHHVAVYKGTSSKEIIKAPRPKDLMRNCIATPAFVAAIVNAKFVNSVPVNRLSAEIERIDDVKILPQNMCRWVNICSERYIARLFDRLRQEIRRKVEELYQNIMEKAREIYGRIKRHLGLDEKGGSPSEPSRRRRTIAVRTAERKRSLMETESFLEERIREGQETDQGISRTGQSIDQTERRLSETEWNLNRTESEIDSIKQRINQQREENESRFREIMKRHGRLMAADKVREREATRLQNRSSQRRDPISTIFNRGGEAYGTGYDDKAAVRTGRGIPESDRKTEWDYPGAGTKAQRDGSPPSGEGSRDSHPGDCNHIEGSPDQNVGAGGQRKGEDIRSPKQLDRRFKKEDQRVGGKTGQSVTPEKPPVIRRKKKVKETLGPRL